MQKPGTHFIVTAKDGRDRKNRLIAACGGDVKSGQILEYLVYMASYQSNQDNRNLQETEYFKVVNFNLDHLAECIKEYYPSISKSTLQRRLKYLESMDYISRDSYHGHYTIYHQAIQQAMGTPPPKKERQTKPQADVQDVVNSNVDHLTTLIDGQNEKIDHLTISMKELADEVYRLRECVKAQAETIIELRRDGQRWSTDGQQMVRDGQQMVKNDGQKSCDEACDEGSEGVESSQHLLSNLSSNLISITPLPPTPVRRVGRTNKSQKPVEPFQPRIPETISFFGDDKDIERLWELYQCQLERVGCNRLPFPLDQKYREAFLRVADFFKGRTESDFIAYFDAVHLKAKQNQDPRYPQYATPGWLGSTNRLNSWGATHTSAPTPPSPVPEPEYETIDQIRARAKAKRDAAKLSVTPQQLLQGARA